MARLLLLVAIAAVLWAGWRRFNSLPPAQRRKSLWQFGAAGIAALLLLLIVSGRLHWLAAILAALVPLLRAAVPLLLQLLLHRLSRLSKCLQLL